MAEEVNRKPHVRPMTAEWIFRHPRYLRYMVREFSCLFIGAWTLLLVCALARLSEGPQAWAAFLEGLQNPLSVALHVVALAFAFYHSVTWFNLTPKALPLQVGEEFVPDVAISSAHFGAWAVLSLVVLYLAGAF
jgi:succinate dehydrogenase subunit C